MQKIISKTVLYMAVITIAALFAASDSIAFYDNCDPDEFVLPMEKIVGPYTITLNNIVENSGNYEWHYTVVNTGTTSLTRLNFLAMLIPKCCNGGIVVDEGQSIPNNIKVFDVAEGEDTLNFGEYNQQAFVIKVTPNDTAEWTVVTNSNTPTLTTALIKYGQGKGVALSEVIPAPGCAVVECPPPPPPEVRVEPRRQCYQFIAETQPPSCPEPAQSSTFLAEWDGGEPCAVEVWAAYGDSWTCDNVKIDENILTGEDLFDTVKDESGNKLSEYRTNNSQCDEGWLRFVDENGCNKRCYVSGGKKYCY